MSKIKWLIIFVLFLNLFFFRSFGPIAFVLIVTSFLLFQFALTGWKKSFSIFIIPVAAYSLLLVLRSSQFVEVILGLGIFVSTGFWLTLLKHKLPFFRSLFGVITSPLDFGVSYISGGIDFLSSIFSGKYHRPSSSWFWVIKGLLIAIPVVYILIFSLTLADPIFKTTAKPFTDYISKLLSGELYYEFGRRIIPSALVAIAASPFLYFYAKKMDIKRPAAISYLLGAKEMIIVMALVALTLLSFIIVQWPYIFANVPFETDLSRFGVATYSEYVKRGFVEFIFISIFIYGIIWAGLLALINSKKLLRTILLSLQMLTLAEFILIFISIGRRVYLYQLYHGLSLGRIYGSIFLLYIAFLAILLFIRHFRKVTLVKYELAGLGFLILLIGFFNAESYIASYHPPTVNKRIDHVYLSRLSSDGYNGWLESFHFANKVLSGNGLERKDIISGDERREVAYAWMILRNLTWQYDRLIQRYGTEEEKREYFRKIYQSEMSNDNVWFLSFDTSKPEIEKQAIRQKYFNRKIVELTVTNPDFDKLAKNMVVGRSSDVYLDYNVQKGIFPSNYAFYGFSLSDYDARTIIGSSNFLDKLYTFNLSDMKVYEKMRKDLPFDRLISLQNRFRQLFIKVTFQSESERDYEKDISLMTPFL